MIGAGGSDGNIALRARQRRGNDFEAALLLSKGIVHRKSLVVGSSYKYFLKSIFIKQGLQLEGWVNSFLRID